MSFPSWPSALPAPAPGLGYSPQDVGVSFEPDIGAPIDRPRTTGTPYVLTPTWTFEGAQITSFATFFDVTLVKGTQTFCMRDPIDLAPRRCRFLRGAYQREFLLRDLARVSAQMMILPGDPWFAPYVPTGSSRVPDFVADYASSVFGVEGLSKPASAVTAISGDYLVERTTTTQVTTAQETLEAGDIPATAPSGTTKIIGFAL
jgi:hypothetical protein